MNLTPAPRCPLCDHLDTAWAEVAGGLNDAPFARALPFVCPACAGHYRVVKHVAFEVVPMAILDMKETAQSTQAPQAVLGQTVRTPGWLDGGLEPGRYRVLRHKGRGAYQLVQGFHFVLDPVDDPHARAALLAYANSVRATNPKLAVDLEEHLTEYKAAADRIQGLAAAQARAASNE
jgi:hypothetical protein